MAYLSSYMIVRQYIVNLLQNHHDPEKPIMSIRDMSEKFGVSRQVISNALEMLVRDGLLVSKSRKGMFVSSEYVCMWRNRTVTRQVPRKIMIIWNNGKQAFYDQFMLRATSILFGELARYNIQGSPAVFIGEEGITLREIAMYEPDGVLWIRPDQHWNSIVHEVRKKIPVCVCDSTWERDGFGVSVDYERAGRYVAELLLKQGCRKPGCVIGKGEMGDVFLSGWNAFLREKGIAPDTFCIFSEDCDIVGSIVQRKNEFDGLWCYDSLLEAVYHGLSEVEVSCPVFSDMSIYSHISDKNLFRIDFTPSEVFRLAAENICHAVLESDFQQENVLLPSGGGLNTAD